MGKKLTFSNNIFPLRTVFLAMLIVALLALWLFGIERQISYVVNRGELLETRDVLAAEVANMEAQYTDTFEVELEAMLASDAFTRDASPIYVTRNPTTRTALNN